MKSRLLAFVLFFSIFSTVGFKSFSQSLAISASVTNVTCFGGNNGEILLTITSPAPPIAQPPYAIDLFYDDGSGSLTPLASYIGVNFTTITFKSGNGSLNVLGADAFGIPATPGIERYRIDVRSTGGTIIQRNKTLFPTVTEPTQLIASVISVTASCAPNIGAISINASGGTQLPLAPPNYVYIWTGSTAIANTVEDPINLADGTYTVTIRDANFNAGNPGFCEVTLSNIVVLGPASITLTSPNANACFNAGATTANLLYSSTTGSPDQYSIDFNAAAEAAGFVDVSSAALTASPIVIAVAAGTAPNTYNATLTVRNSTSGCLSGSTAITVTVTPNNTVSAPSATPTLCINTVLTNITHTTTGATGIGAATGLPTGVSAAWAANVITISGTPTASGTFNYSIPLTGGCGTVSATGTITVSASNTVGAASSTPTLCINTALTNITHNTTGATGIGAATGLPSGVSAVWAANVITISGTPTASGTFNYSIPLTGGCGAVNATGTITVTPNNTASAASSTPTLCINTVLTNITHTTIGATGIGAAIGLPAGVSAAWAANVITISGTPTASGTFNYSIPLTGGCGTVNATGTITVTPDNTASAASSTPTLCINTALTNITHTTIGATGIGAATGLPSGVSALWAANVITISGTPTASGTFNYSIPLTGGCGAVNATGTITVLANNTVGPASSTPTLCINTALTNITHTTTGATGIGAAIGLPAGVSAAWAANVITISGTPTASGTFNYSIPLTGGCGTVSATGTITVTPGNTASAASSTPTLCINTVLTNITHTTIGATGIGAATGLPAGVSAAWAANVITISGTPTASGTFNYSILLTGGCGTVNATGTITVNALPTASLSGTTTICSGSPVSLTVTLTGVGPWVFTYSDGTTASGNINSVFNIFTIPVTPSPTATTTYTLVSVSDANCTGTIIGTPVTVTVDSTPNTTLAVSAAVSPLCNGGSTTVNVANSENGVSYQLRNGATAVGGPVSGNGGVINLSTGPLNVTTTFNVEATRGVCTPAQLTNTATITVAGTISSGLAVTPQAATVCSGTATNIQVALSENGVNYQLRDNSNNSTIGGVVAGNGATINLPTGNLIANTTFNILASNGTCSVQLNNLATVNVDVNPNAGLVVGATLNPLCSGGNTDITVAGSEVGVSYQLRDNATNALVGVAVAGTGATINLPTGNLLATTTFNVLATGGAACAPAQLTSTITITVAGAINVGLTVTPQAPTVCSGTGTNIQVANSEAGVNYQLRDNANDSNVGPIVPGTGATIDLATGNLLASKTFNVLASNATCSIQLTALATVTVDINPNAGLTTAASVNPVCTGGNTSITVAASEIGVSYQLRDASNVNVGIAVAGTGGTISLPTGALAANTTFNVLASGGVCTAVQLTSTVSVTVGGALNTGLPVIAQAATICSGTATNIQVSNSEAGVLYQLRNDLNDAFVGAAVAGTGATINLPTGNLLLTTTFNVLATSVTCSIEMTTLPTVTVNALPNAALGVAAQTAAVCSGTATNIQVSNSQVGVTYQLRDNTDNSLIGAAVAGTGATINLPTGNLTVNKTFNVLANGGGTCTVQLTSTATVNVLLATDPLCTGGGGTGTCATVVITPVPSPAQCTLSNGQMRFTINPATPVVNNTGVKITITGISSTNLTIARTNFNDPLFTGLPMGTYSYSIEYGDPSCIKNGQVTVDQSGTVGTPVSSNPINAICFGSATGSITLDVPGETGNLLEWSVNGITFNTFIAGNQVSGIPAGAAPSFQRVLSVRRNATDPCFAQVTIVISEPADMVAPTTVTNATCNNNDGSILVGAVSGGTGPYTFKLDGVAVTLPTNNTLTGLSGGNHTLTVTDSRSCSKDLIIPVVFPGFVNYETAVIDPDCTSNGSNGGIIVAILTSGTFDVGVTTDPVNPPTSFVTITSTGGDFTTFSNLSKGTYQVYVKSVTALCPTKSVVTINGGPTKVDFSLAPSDILCFGSKGTVALSAIIGSPFVNYSYEILNQGLIAQSGTITLLQALGNVTLSGLDKGDYQMRIFQDQSVASGCVAPITSAFKPFSIEGPDEALDTLFVHRTISFPDLPTGSMLIGIKESKQEPYEVRLELVEPLFPSQAFVMDWTPAPSNPQKIEYSVKRLFAGDYELKIRDALGCVKTYPVTIKVDTNVFVPNIFTPNGDGVNETFYIRNLPTGSKLVVANRWGKEVFSSSDYQNDWTAGDTSDGIYYYRLLVDGQARTGWVEILR